jgi:hypothetical protein
MKQIVRRLCALSVLLITAGWLSVANAAIINLDLRGTGGVGLLPTNENPATTGGSGGEVGAGISFDDVTLALTINIAWGSGNGFTDLTGTASAGHIHGPTLDPAPTSFTENAGVAITLSSLGGWNSSATNGGFSGTVTLSSGQATDLLAGKLYINVHTTANPNGEIRGYLVVPEPSSFALLAIGLGCGAVPFLRRKR